MLLLVFQIVLAIRVLGLGVVYGVCAGCIILSSFVLGVSATSLWGDPPCVMDSPGAAACGLVILIAAVAGLAWFGSPKNVTPAPDASNVDSASIARALEHVSIDTSSVIAPAPQDAITVTVPEASAAVVEAVAPAHKSVVVLSLQLLGTAVISLFAGACVVPMKMAQLDGVNGLGYVIPFAFCVFALTWVVAAIDVLVRKRRLQFHFSVVGLPACVSGLAWSIGE